MPRRVHTTARFRLNPIPAYYFNGDTVSHTLSDCLSSTGRCDSLDNFAPDTFISSELVRARRNVSGRRSWPDRAAEHRPHVRKLRRLTRVFQLSNPTCNLNPTGTHSKIDRWSHAPPARIYPGRDYRGALKLFKRQQTTQSRGTPRPHSLARPVARDDEMSATEKI